MLARYQIVRGKRAVDDPLPDGKRIDTRKHTRHFLRPDSAQVEALLADPNSARYAKFKQTYNALSAERFAQDREPFTRWLSSPQTKTCTWAALIHRAQIRMYSAVTPCSPCTSCTKSIRSYACG